MELLQKLKLLEENISILENIKEDVKLQDITANKRYEWELRYGLFESIQIMIDISCKITNYYNLGNPQNYRECIELLGKFNFLNAMHVKRYISMIGLRNLLIHEYATIDHEKLYAFLESIDDFKNFIKEIKTSTIN
ncbi:MAG: HepT-like ribonuclease domain-containing protein [Campylobacterota bacterium]